VRLFIALNLPDDVRTALHEATAPLREAAPRAVAWVRPEGVHLTLKFLGDVEEPRVAHVEAALRRVAAAHAVVRVAIGGVGAFPSLARPRVVWAGVEASPRLELLQHDVEAACAALGFEVEGRAFRPHVTLGRVRPNASAEPLRALAVAASRCDPRADVMVPTLDLMASTLMAGGARHDAVARLPFREE
jgi:RNA 2',3'-cyclic 3'-phosphodiesterase